MSKDDPSLARMVESTSEQLRQRYLNKEELSISGHGFEGLPLGSSIEQAHAIFGKPSKITKYSDDIYHIYDGFKLVFQDEVLGIIFLEGRIPAVTDRGIREGATHKQLESAYGEPSSQYPSDKKYASSGWWSYDQHGILFNISGGCVSGFDIWGPKS
ncbi:MAG TPA: hypothetical protein DCE42_27210 [Myxococcales bacterium]|nr:hypothetical protein [Deltaproteobacteria bacterium]MBU49639.1 hypothetical protein [Deltaproteobacteria bacterium]HAA58482.1 hypothetical protein [Myxococcales bacterium]